MSNLLTRAHWAGIFYIYVSTSKSVKGHAMRRNKQRKIWKWIKLLFEERKLKMKSSRTFYKVPHHHRLQVARQPAHLASLPFTTFLPYELDGFNSDKDRDCSHACVFTLDLVQSSRALCLASVPAAMSYTNMKPENEVEEPNQSL